MSKQRTKSKADTNGGDQVFMLVSREISVKKDWADLYECIYLEAVSCGGLLLNIVVYSYRL